MISLEFNHNASDEMRPLGAVVFVHYSTRKSDIAITVQAAPLPCDKIQVCQVQQQQPTIATTTSLLLSFSTSLHGLATMKTSHRVPEIICFNRLDWLNGSLSG